MKRFALMLLIPVLLAAAFACSGNAVESAQTPAPIQTEPPVEIVVDEVTIPVTELVVSSAEEMPDLEKLSQMTALRLLDLTALPYTPYETIAQISRNCPNCRILWNQMLTDGVFRSDSESLTLPHATAEDVDLLDAFTDLKSVDASGSTAYGELYAYRTKHPDVEVHYTLTLGDAVIAEDAETIVVPVGTNAQQLTQDLKAFDRIREADLRESGWDDASMEAFADAFPNIAVFRTVRLGDQTFDSEAEMLDLRAFSGWTPVMLIEKLAAFHRLKTVALPTEWQESDAQRIKAAFPDLSVVGTVTAFGLTFEGTAEEVDLTRIKMQTTDDVEAMLSGLPFLKKLVMCECGLSNEQMEELCERHPNVKFVWTIEIGKRKLRTDALGFSTKNPSKYTSSKATDAYNESVKKAVRLYEGDIEALKYCTDLEALDLGHNYLTNNDLVVISKLTKLKVLILADNKITDISILTTLKDLEYVELFMNRIPDLSPLCEMPSLVDVNVCNTGVSDLSPLFKLTWVKRLWYAMNPYDRAQAKALKEALSDCLCNNTTTDETGEGWREDPRYKWMRAYFKDS